jgi:hypothetical protein
VNTNGSEIWSEQGEHLQAHTPYNSLLVVKQGHEEGRISPSQSSLGDISLKEIEPFSDARSRPLVNIGLWMCETTQP